MTRRHSLRTRFLLPLLVAASLAALAVAWGSWLQGKRWAMDEIRQRYQSIRVTLKTTSFPLSPNVVDSLAALTTTEWATLDREGTVLSSTLVDSPELRRELEKALRDGALNQPPGGSSAVSTSGFLWNRVRWMQSDYYARSFSHARTSSGQDAVATVVILFSKQRVDIEARRAALLPLVTGLSTLVLITALMYWLSSRLIGRLRRLESQVAQIAEGKFESRLAELPADEVGRLAGQINQMAGQLSQLWERVQQEQGTKLLHQIAAGMAHQLRNTMTGARMAMELHQGHCQADAPGEIEVALRQLEIAEDYVNRLLTVGSSSETEDHPMPVAICIDDVRSTHQPIADHLNVRLDWTVDPGAGSVLVSDGPSLTAAVSNLVLNALHAGKRVTGTIRCDQDHCLISICDDGAGIDPAIADNVFDPFVSSRPEGMGLGLPVVRRAAERLEGTVTWKRESDQTCFELTCRTQKVPEA